MQHSNVIALSKRSQPSLAVTVRQNDHTVLSSLIAERRLEARTLLIDAKNHLRHEGLRTAAQNDGRVLWLDPQAMELALPFGVTDAHLELPWARWAGARTALSTSESIQFAEAVAEFVSQEEYGGVLAPTHFLQEGRQDWFEQDGRVAMELRNALDRRRLDTVKIIYPLATTAKALHDERRRVQILRALSNLPLDLVSFRLNGFGKNSGPIVVRNVISALRELRGCNHQLMIERAGIVGHALYAMGLVDTVETGIAAGEAYDLSHRLKPPAARRGGAYQGVMIESLGATIAIKVAQTLWASNQGRTRFSCADHSCCPQGAKSMLANRRRHSLLAQQRQFDRLAALPPSRRFEHFVSDVFSPLCDMLSRASEIVPTFRSAHLRSLSVKEMLKTQLQDSNRAVLTPRPVRPVPSVARVVRFPTSDTSGKDKT